MPFFVLCPATDGQCCYLQVFIPCEDFMYYALLCLVYSHGWTVVIPAGVYTV